MKPSDSHDSSPLAGSEFRALEQVRVLVTPLPLGTLCVLDVDSTGYVSAPTRMSVNKEYNDVSSKPDGAPTHLDGNIG
eukprot:COSAG02_NODE_4773_length_4994_cov_3.910725_3_plen_78_part_00